MSFGSDVIVSISGQADTVTIDPKSTVEIPPPSPPAPPPTGGPNRAWAAAAGKPETATPLPGLPAGLELGDGVDEPIHFDAARKLLLYRGFMCHGSYLYLRHQSEDLSYLAALDQLYVKSAGNDSAKRGAGMLMIALGVVAAGLALALWCLLR